MKNKGFTLIELLAVIVILAIIALIATPIVLNIIEDAKESAILRSAEYYVDAVEIGVAKERLDNKKVEDGTYNILSNGNICLVYEDLECVDELEVSVSGDKPTSGTITIGNGKISKVNKLTISDKKVSTNSKNELEIKEYQIYKITYENITDTTNLITQIEEGETLEIDLAGKNIVLEKLKVKINNELITNYTYKNYVLTIPNVTGDITVIGGTKYLVSYTNIENTTGLPTTVIEGSMLEIDLTGKAVEAFKVYVEGKEVTNYEYNNNRIKLTNVSGDVIVRKLNKYKVDYENIDVKTNLPEEVIEGNTLEINLENKGISDGEITVKVNGTEIDNYIYKDYLLTIPEVTGDVLVIGEKIPTAVSFATDSWETIIANVQAGNADAYRDDVGQVKTLTLTGYVSDKTYGSIEAGDYKVRLANTSNNDSICTDTTNQKSQTACGFVIEFVDVITKHVMNENYTNIGGWPVSDLRKYVTPVDGVSGSGTIYNAIDPVVKNAIIKTRVVSGYGKYDAPNKVSIDYLYLLEPIEIYGTADGYDTAKDETRQLDYYANLEVTTSNDDEVKKTYLDRTSSHWWLRSARNYDQNYFYNVYGGGALRHSGASSENGVAPAFRLGPIE